MKTTHSPLPLPHYMGIFLVCLLSMYGNTAKSQNYCQPTIYETYIAYMTYVGLGDIQNHTTVNYNIGYHDFTAMSTDIEVGSTMTIDVHGSGGETMDYFGWIDYNQDDLFTADERIFLLDQSGPGSSSEHSFTFQVPENSLLGPTRMRIAGTYYVTYAPDGGHPTLRPSFEHLDGVAHEGCAVNGSDIGYTEIEDYTVNIVTLSTPLDYCEPSVSESYHAYITHVQIGDISNTTTVDYNTGYHDFTHMTTDLEIGNPTTIQVNGENDYSYGMDYFGWIDCDQDGFFTEDERIFLIDNSGNNAPATNTIVFTVPVENTVEGPTRMRIVGCHFQAYDESGGYPETRPCFSHLDNTAIEACALDPSSPLTFMEMEDYTVNLRTSMITQPNNDWEFAYDEAGNRISRSLVAISSIAPNDALLAKARSSFPYKKEELVSAASSFLIHPNPTSDYAIVRNLDDTIVEGTLRLYHISGGLISEKTWTGTSAELDLTNVQDGTYLLILESEGRIVTTRKVIKQ